MTLATVIDKWIGKRYKEPGFATYECVGWVKCFVSEMGRPKLGRFGGVGAYQGRVNNNKTFGPEYERIENTPSAIPVEGDIIIFKPTKTNKHGHIAIADDADIRAITVVEQNGATGDGDGLGGDEIRRANYTYKNVVGRWHYKGSMPIVPMPDPLIQQLIDNGIYNGIEGDGVTNRTALMMAKLYDKLLKLTGNK